MKTFIAIVLFILVSNIPLSVMAQDSPPIVPQPITTLKSPQLPQGAELDAVIAAEPSKYGKFRLEKTEECDQTVFFDRTIPKKQEHVLLKMKTCSEYQTTIDKIGDVEFPFITPDGEEFHLFEVEVNAGNGKDAVWFVFQAIVLDKNRAWVSEEMTVVPAYNAQLDQSVDLDNAYISQQQGKTILSLVVPPTTRTAGQTFFISMGSFEAKRVDPLPRWAKSTRTFKMIGTFEAITDTARGNLPCISGKEMSMEPSINPPTSDKEYCIDHIGACSLSTSEDEFFESVPAEMTLLETVWSDGALEYSCLYLKGL